MEREQLESVEDLKDKLNKLFASEFESWADEQVELIGQGEKPEDIASKVDAFKNQLVDGEKEKQAVLQKIMDALFTGLEKMLEATSLYENNSLFHMVIKSEVEMIIATQEEMKKDIAKVGESNTSLISEIEAYKIEEEFKKDDFKALLQKVKQLRIDQAQMYSKIKKKEVSLIALVFMEELTGGQAGDAGQFSQLAEVCRNLTETMKELLND